MIKLVEQQGAVVSLHKSDGQVFAVSGPCQSQKKKILYYGLIYPSKNPYKRGQHISN